MSLLRTMVRCGNGFAFRSATGARTRHVDWTCMERLEDDINKLVEDDGLPWEWVRIAFRNRLLHKHYKRTFALDVSTKTVHDAFSLTSYPPLACTSFQASVHQTLLNQKSKPLNLLAPQAPGKVKTGMVECCDKRICEKPELGHVAQTEDYKILRFQAAMHLSKLLDSEVKSTDLVWSAVNYYDSETCFAPPTATCRITTEPLPSPS